VELVEKYKVTVMFSAPTAVRVLKKQDPAFSPNTTCPACGRCSWPASRWTSPRRSGSARAWANPSSTTTGRPRPAGRSWACNGVEKAPSKFGSPGKAVYGYNVKLLDDQTGEELTGANQKGVVAIEGPLPPGCMQTVWRDDERFRQHLLEERAPAGWSTAPSTGASATPDGYFFILGRTDDVINVAGHRLGTREIEESISSHPQRRRSGRGGRGRSAQGPGGHGLCHAKDASRCWRRRRRPCSSWKARS
jgi:propionyl-CoA synthetase